MAPTNWARHAEELLLDRGAADVEHPGGTLLQHLRRTASLLRTWGMAEDLEAAGLCHACYGTDGFPVGLLELDERWRLSAVIGERAESLVYRYASCDRASVYPRLALAPPLLFTDRFTGLAVRVDKMEAAAFLALTAANELDLVLSSPAKATAWAPGFLDLLRGARSYLSPVALTAWEDVVPPLLPGCELRTAPRESRS